MQELTEVAREHGVYVGFSPSCLTPHRAHNLQYRAALLVWEGEQITQISRTAQQKPPATFGV